MWKIWKFSVQSGLELMATGMIDEVFTNWTTEAVLLFCGPQLKLGPMVRCSLYLLLVLKTYDGRGTPN